MSKHLPGPWKHEPYDDHTSFCGSRDTPDYDFRVEWSAHIPEKERRATDDLIGAAPDLLGACEDALNDLTQTVNFDEGCPQTRATVDKLVSAINKAKRTECPE